MAKRNANFMIQLCMGLMTFIITDEDYSLESEYGDLALAYALANSVKYYIINWK